MATHVARLKDIWRAQQQKHDAKLQGGFKGVRNSSERFKAKVLQELVTNTATPLTLADLEKKAASVFGPTPTTEVAVPAADASKPLAHEAHPIL